MCTREEYASCFFGGEVFYMCPSGPVGLWHSSIPLLPCWSSTHYGRWAIEVSNHYWFISPFNPVCFSFMYFGGSVVRSIFRYNYYIFLMNFIIMKCPFISSNIFFLVKVYFVLGCLGDSSQLSAALLISARVMISWFVRSSPTTGSVLTVQSLLGILSLSLFLPYLCSLSLSK